MTWHLLNAPFCPNRKHTENLKSLNLNTRLHEPRPSLSSATRETQPSLPNPYEPRSSLSSATRETQPSLPNHYEPRPSIGAEPMNPTLPS